MDRRGVSEKPASFWSSRSLRTKALIVISLPVAALIASSILVVITERTKDEEQLMVRHVFELRAQLLTGYIMMSSAESATRNFALTGSADGIQPLPLVGPAIEANFDRMVPLLSGDKDQTGRLDLMRKRTLARLDGIRQVHEFYEAHRDAHETPPPAMLDAAKIAPELLVAITNFFTAEAKVVQDKARAYETRIWWLHAGLVTSLILGLFGAISAAILFTGGIVRRIRQLESIAANLENGVPRGAIVPNDDELGRLGAAMESAGAILANQDHELKMALENAQVLIWDLDAESGRIRYRAGAGAPEDSILPVELLAPNLEGWISGVHTDDRNEVRAELQRSMSTGDPLQIEYRVVIRGGEIRWMAVNAHRCDSGAGRPERFLGVLSDITERRHAALEIERQAHELVESREALQQQTRILRSILDSMGDGVVVVDTEGKTLAFNPAAQQILGARAFSGDTSRWTEHCGLFLPDKKSPVPADQLPFALAIRGNAVDSAEILVHPADMAESKWVSITARPLRQDDGAIRGAVMVLRDITSAKLNADALELAKHEAENANQAKSEFLSRMSHELRTPLNSILGFAQLLELASLTEQQSDNVSHILKGGYHLLDLINEVLDLARIEAGRLSLSPEAVQIRDVLRDALDLVQPLAMEEKINITWDAANQCDCHVHADGQRLKQVLLNLLSNAIKFNRHGGSIIISCHEIPGNRLRVDIADSGCGISPEGLQKLFTPFERLAADRTDVGGTGLGLALSKRLMEAMGGSIGAESAVGLGSRFFIELALIEDPVRWLERSREALEVVQRESAAYRGTVLYIEDNASNLRLIERIMAHCPDVRLITAMQGQLGLDLAQMHAPDWILLDLHLPDISGEEVLGRLRDNVHTRAIPVTILSADATRGQVSRLMSAGARDYLTKPVDVRQLLKLLDQTLRQPTAPVRQPEAAGLEASYAERDRSK